MTGKIFCDTSCLYSLFIVNDSLNLISEEVLEEILEKYKATLITTDLVQYECLSKLRKHGIDYCKKFQQLIQKEILNIHKTDDDLVEKGLVMFWGYEDKDWGIIDCISISYMRDNNIIYVYGMDDHFRQAGLFPLVRMNNLGIPEKSYTILNLF